MTETRKPLLIVEDDPALQKQMQWAFDQYETIVANDRTSAIAQVRRFEPAVVTMDLGLPPSPDDPSEGLKLLEELHTLMPSAKVIVLTGQNDRDNALKAISMGAHDFCTKPFEPELLTWTIERAFRVHELQEENARLAAARESPSTSGIITRAPAMLRICRTIEKVAPTSATVLILGESGTGKELLARALHDLSPRSGGRFVAINCAAIPETLLESELFGYEKGAFTGAVKQTLGKIETASGGTLFLDEIGDLPTALQAKLLRFLQERVIERIGGRQEIPVDVRIVCATHQSLKEQIERGRFREDLYYRLAEIVVEIPPLRARQGDAALLAHSFVRKFGAEQRRGTMTLLPDAIEAIDAHGWPGNVRELENVIKRAVIMADSESITAVDIGLEAADGDAGALNLRHVREQAEKNAVLRVLGRVNGNLSRAAELLGVSRPTLYDLMHRYGLK
ncbi:MAG TPA: PEP-CTERM-box response regulator transcription factor [Casimicrobiaceae bacterium]|jgi:two-component system NtrC family response regulator|nr:PEP-CTERM-box response regulator transcription factor [Casimicrobiaceae bacterium]